MASSIVFGAESEFLSVSGGVDHVSTTALNVSGFVVAYRDVADSNHGTAKIGTVSGTDVTFGSETEFLSTGSARFMSTTVLSESGFIVSYRDEFDGNHGTAKFGTISGTTITFGAETEYNNSETTHNDVTVISESGFVVAYRDGGDGGYGKARIGTVSGTTITFGSPTTFLGSDNTLDIHVGTLSSSGFVVVYRNVTTGYGIARIGTISGTTITFGPATIFHDASTVFYLPVSIIDSTKFVVSWRGTAPDAPGRSIVGSISGTDITFGDPFGFSEGGIIEQVYSATLNDSRFVVAWQAAVGYGTVKVGNINGTDISFNDKTEITKADDISIIALTESGVVISYSDLLDSNHGTSQFGQVATLHEDSSNLFMYGRNNIEVSGDLFLYGLLPYSGSINLFTQGTSEVDTSVRIINHLTRTADYDPQLMGYFKTIPPINVNIEVWDVGDGNNTKQAIINSGCYPIGDIKITWGWSTAHLVNVIDKKKYHFYYRMTSNDNREEYGEFFFTVPEDGIWSYPD